MRFSAPFCYITCPSLCYHDKSERIDSIIKRFLWNGTMEVNNKYHLIPQGQVCKPRDMGGLGVLDLKIFNMALTKQRWHLISRPNGALQWFPFQRYKPRKNGWYSGFRKSNNLEIHKYSIIEYTNVVFFENIFLVNNVKKVLLKGLVIMR